jgi:hypothetical protein
VAEIGERLLCCKAVGPGPYGCHTAVTQIDNFGYMDEQYAIDGLAALLQSTRLKAFRLLVSHEPGGVAAGEIARAMDVPQNTIPLGSALDCCPLHRHRRPVLPRSVLSRRSEKVHTSSRTNSMGVDQLH